MNANRRVSYQRRRVSSGFFRACLHRWNGYVTQVSAWADPANRAVSNLADRIRDGQVTDFVDFQFWPVFNVADSSVVIGIGLLAWLIIVRERGTQSSE